MTITVCFNASSARFHLARSPLTRPDPLAFFLPSWPDPVGLRTAYTPRFPLVTLAKGGRVDLPPFVPISTGHPRRGSRTSFRGAKCRSAARRDRRTTHADAAPRGPSDCQPPAVCSARALADSLDSHSRILPGSGARGLRTGARSRSAKGLAPSEFLVAWNGLRHRTNGNCDPGFGLRSARRTFLRRTNLWRACRTSSRHQPAS